MARKGTEGRSPALPWRSARVLTVTSLIAGLISGAGLGTLGTLATSQIAGAAAAYQANQWGLTAIDAPAAWSYGTGAGVKIGLVDTGVDTSQVDLVGKVVAQKNFVSSPTPPSCAGAYGSPSALDDNGHGTHVAGIAAAAGSGVFGVAPKAQLVVAKALDCKGNGYYQDVSDAIAWVVSQGARVVNLSLGDAGTALVDPNTASGQPSPLGPALIAAWNSGAIPVVAAGNNSNGVLGLGQEDFRNVPAIVVAATGPKNEFANYSNSVDMAEWGVAAPGGDYLCPDGLPVCTTPTPTCGTYTPGEIFSTYWTSKDPSTCYASDEGTSMAAPFVSGTLALLLGRGMSNQQAVNTLFTTADTSVSCGSDCKGLINAGAAMRSASGPAGPSNRAPGVSIDGARPATGAPAHGVAPSLSSGAAGTPASSALAGRSGNAPGASGSAIAGDPSAGGLGPSTAASGGGERTSELHVASPQSSVKPTTASALIAGAVSLLVIALLVGLVFLTRRYLLARRYIEADEPIHRG